MLKELLLLHHLVLCVHCQSELLELFPQGLVELGNLNGLKEKTMDLVYKDEVKPKTNTFTSERMISSTLQVYRDLLSKPS